MRPRQNRSSLIEIDDEFAFFLGAFIAEGSITYRHLINLAFSKEEPIFYNRVCNFLRQRFDVDANPRLMLTLGISGKVNHAIAVTTSSNGLAAFLSQFGDKAENKSLPYWIFALSQHVQDSLVRGMYWGDGHISINGAKTSHVAGYSTVSVALIEQVAEILERRGYHFEIETIQQLRRPIFRIRLYGWQARDFASFVGKPEKGQQISWNRYN